MENIAFTTRDFWDDSFFEEFSQFKNDIYHGEQYYIEESLGDLCKELTSPYFKKEKLEFKAFLFSDGKKPIARVICYFDPNFPEFCNFGHFEILKNYSLQSFMMTEIEKFARYHKAIKLRGPIQGNFFFSYRMKIDGDFKFYGEPYHQNFYPQILEEWGFTLTKKWFTEKIVQKSLAADKFKQIRNVSTKKNKRHKIYAKFIFPWRWDKYVEYIFDLFTESYKDMPEYSPVDFDTFKMMYDDFKHIINPFLSYIIFHKDKPIGFTITFFDPLDLIYNYQEKMEKVEGKWSKMFQKIKLLVQLKFNGGNLLIMYSGKVPGPNGEVFKGIQALASKYISVFYHVFGGKGAYVCYLGEDSPAYTSFSQKNQKPLCTYGMYYKSIESKQ